MATQTATLPPDVVQHVYLPYSSTAFPNSPKLLSFGYDSCVLTRVLSISASAVTRNRSDSTAAVGSKKKCGQSEGANFKIDIMSRMILDWLWTGRITHNYGKCQRKTKKYLPGVNQARVPQPTTALNEDRYTFVQCLPALHSFRNFHTLRFFLY
jgi:hypothetical protein